MQSSFDFGLIHLNAHIERSIQCLISSDSRLLPGIIVLGCDITNISLVSMVCIDCNISIIDLQYLHYSPSNHISFVFDIFKDDSITKHAHPIAILGLNILLESASLDERIEIENIFSNFIDKCANLKLPIVLSFGFNMGLILTEDLRSRLSEFSIEILRYV